MLSNEPSSSELPRLTATSNSTHLDPECTNSSVNLQRNSIGDKGLKALSEALKEITTLQSLNLDNNSIGDEGAKALSEALKENTTLQSLNLHRGMGQFVLVAYFWIILMITQYNFS